MPTGHNTSSDNGPPEPTWRIAAAVAVAVALVVLSIYFLL
jgi:hypothetical protein